MGNISLNINCSNEEYMYSYPIPGTEDDNSTEIRRSKDSINSELIDNFQDKVNNCWEILLHGRKVSNNGYYFGIRSVKKDGTLGDYIFVRYSYVIRKAQEIGSGLSYINGFEEREYENGKLKLKCVALFSNNSLNWSITEHSCNAYGITIIPLYDVLGDGGLIYILNSTKPKSVFCSLTCAKKLIPLLESINSVKFLILLDNDLNSLDGITEYAKENVKMMNFDELAKIGKNNLIDANPGNLDSINSIHFTSGTTGNPKGVILPNRSWVACCAGFIYGQLGREGTKLDSSDFHISYLPLAHIFERVVHMTLTYVGAKIGFYSGDIHRLVDDIQALKPTIFITVPRVLNRIHDKVMLNVRQKPKYLQLLFNFALQQKEKKSNPFHILWDSIIFNKIREMMGGRVRAILSAAAPLDRTILSRIRCFSCSYCIEGYGMTEILAAFMPEISDNSLQNIGGPSPSYEFKLVSIPEMDYSAKSNPPAGELLVRGPPSFIGYFNDEEETNSMICKKEGWIKTGDICQLLPNGALRIIDRRKNIFKLSQGEYVAPEKLENIFIISCELISQALIIGRSTESYLVAIFVLDEEFAMKYVRSRNIGDNLKFEELANHSEILEKIRNDISKAEKQYNLLGYEKIKFFKCITTPFSVENELLTPTFKVVRHKAIKFYEEMIDEMYRSNL